MSSFTIHLLRAVIAVCLLGSLAVQTVIVPLVWLDMSGTPTGPRIAVAAIAVLGVLTMQVFGACVWRLLTLVRRGTVFSTAAFRFVDVIIGAIGAAAAVALAFAVLLALGHAAPGVVALVCGGALVLAGMALLVVVMRELLRQAIRRDGEARALRTELDGVI